MNFENGVVTFRHEYPIIDEWNETTFYDGYKYVHPAPTPIEGRMIVGRADEFGLESLMASTMVAAKAINELTRALEQMVADTERSLRASCPNRRVAHLATYGRSKRVRNKNFKRMMKLVVEESKKERKND